MANRTTVKSNIVAQNVPTVTNAILTGMLNTQLADNVRFREDVAVVQNSSSSTITVDFVGKDRVDLTRTGGGLAISVTGIEDGETKFLLITKTAGQIVTWVGITDVTPVKANADVLPLVLYEIVRKGANYFVKAWVESPLYATDTVPGVLQTASVAECLALTNQTNAVTPGRIPISSDSQRGVIQMASQAEHNALTGLNACVPGRLPIAGYAQKGLIQIAGNSEMQNGTDETLAVTPYGLRLRQNWQNLTLNAGWSGQLQYFVDNLGFVHIMANQLKRSTGIAANTSAAVCTLPGVAEPQFDMKWTIQSYNPANQNSGVFHSVVAGAGIDLAISTSIHSYTADWLIKFYIIYRRTA